ncbi:hypothetical protein BKA81DRAFT_402478 [Phyllosticta paracitricarpa]|uniref:Uncharacterized protein n=1 Tax=Phyllosticta paracitricarpa TaxID=2016321 RepID=A0ABR1NJK3_9PEZI
MSARHLPSLAAVHFCLAPANKQQQQQQHSSSGHTSSIMTSSTTSSSKSRQRRSWPREQDLPDIDEDPFAHFLSPMTEEELDSPFADHDDALTFSAGIIVSDDEETSGIDEDRDAEMEEEARAMEREMERNMAVDEGYMSEEVASSSSPVPSAVVGHKKKTRPKRPGPDPLVLSPQQQPYRAVVREPTKGRAQDLVDGRMSKRRKYRHSWRAPDRDLFTVVEEQCEPDGDASEIEQPFFSAF